MLGGGKGIHARAKFDAEERGRVGYTAFEVLCPCKASSLELDRQLAKVVVHGIEEMLTLGWRETCDMEDVGGGGLGRRDVFLSKVISPEKGWRSEEVRMCDTAFMIASMSCVGVIASR